MVELAEKGKERHNELFKRLTQLFRGGPSIKRKVRAFRTPAASTAVEIFKKSYSQVYSNALNAYGQYDRMSRYADFSEMEYTPEISSALDIYSEETTSVDDKNMVLHIYSNNPKIQALLDELYHDTLNVEHNLAPWTRNLCKYGDFFLFIDIHPEMGVLNTFPMPVNEVERDEGWDPQNPLAVRFRWVTQGNQILEPWNVAHFRLVGNDSFLPYGSSVLESARRIWRQLILIEDAMLVYRVVRSPERRVFYIDVGTVPTEEIPNYMEAAQSKLKRAQVIDKATGRIDLRYNPLSVDEDYFIPVRGGESGTKIDTLAGGQHVSDIADVEYIQKKLFAALKVPRAYLGYDESLSSKATLAQEDIRFSRSINRVQQVLVSELQKIGIIHLFTHGFEGDDLADFTIYLSNPSTVAQMQKLELWRTKFEIAATVPEGLADRDFLRKEIFKLTEEQIDDIKDGRRRDRLEDLELEASELEGNTPTGGSVGGSGGLGGLGSGGSSDNGNDVGDTDANAFNAGGDSPSGGDEGGDEGNEGGDEDLFAGDRQEGDELLIATDNRIDLNTDNDEIEIQNEPDIRQGPSLSRALDDISKANREKIRSRGPVLSTSLSKYLYNRDRRRTHGARKTHIPDFHEMLKPDNDVFDNRHFKGSPFKDMGFSSKDLSNSVREGFQVGDRDIETELFGAVKRAKLSSEMRLMLTSLSQRLNNTGKRKQQPIMLAEVETDSDVDVVIEEDVHAENVRMLEDISLETNDIQLLVTDD
jgi:hypothetical protein